MVLFLSKIFAERLEDSSWMTFVSEVSTDTYFGKSTLSVVKPALFKDSWTWKFLTRKEES
jgi:hypothetical protein